MNIEKILKALADRNRLRILNLLFRKELCVCEIEEILDLSQTNVSRHLSKLMQSGLLDSSKEAQWVFYRINKDFFEKHHALAQYLKSSFNKDEIFTLDRKKFEKMNKLPASGVMIRCERI